MENQMGIILIVGSLVIVLLIGLVKSRAEFIINFVLRGVTGMLIIYCVAAVVRMSNWVQNDTYRSAGDAAFGTILEIAFMYLMVLPCVCLTGLV